MADTDRLPSDVRLIETSERYAAKFRAALDRVARERAYLILLEAPPAEVFASNTRAIRLYERLGFVHEGVKRKARKVDEAYDDLVVMALL